MGEADDTARISPRPPRAPTCAPTACRARPAEGLAQHALRGSHRAPRRDALRGAGDIEHPQGGIAAAGRIGQGQAVQPAAEVQVGHQHAARRLVGAEALQRLVGVGGLPDLEARGFEHVADEEADRRLVLDHEHARLRQSRPPRGFRTDRRRREREVLPHRRRRVECPGRRSTGRWRHEAHRIFSLQAGPQVLRMRSSPGARRSFRKVGPPTRPRGVVRARAARPCVNRSSVGASTERTCRARCRPVFRCAARGRRRFRKGGASFAGRPASAQRRLAISAVLSALAPRLTPRAGRRKASSDHAATRMASAAVARRR